MYKWLSKLYMSNVQMLGENPMYSNSEQLAGLTAAVVPFSISP